ncbi:penicillin-binding protein 2 [Microbispora amethystogenes]|uniref:Penicillin-binding protein 2 n=1 Tax=Microbispora amethystogenes TaxID=1427754 RepID=A0ABQ4FG28_9ACTN|nr:penicillin-binding protein 2 [Microbispora amethystogenes]GIH33775.1 penicillin-binding protein 2 [Microbispora amethystogenes]
MRSGARGSTPGGIRGNANRGRLTVVFVVVTTLMLTLLGRLWYLQVVTGSSYSRAATESRVRSVVLPPVRGQILDVRGRPLVANETRPQVSVDYMALLHQPDGGTDVLTRLARALGRPYQELADRARLCGRDVPRPCWPGSPYQPIVVADDVSVRTALWIAERQNEFPGVSTALRPVRTYPLGPAAAHVLGYLQPPSPDDPEGGPELIGRDGLEARYDRDLAGRTGIREVAVDSTGKVTGLIREEAAVPGETLVTSIDARIQDVAERALARAVAGARGRGEPADSGAAVVLEAKTGRVTAIADYPSYDPVVWTGGISQRAYEDLPLISAAVQGQWAPGSTWKVTSTAAAAKAGYGLRDSYDCPGGYKIGGRVFHNFESAELGRMDMRRALVVSCDTIFYRFAERMWKRDGGLTPVKRPKDPMQEMAKEFGFGTPTGIDLPHEAAGRVPDRAWKKANWERTRADACRRAKSGYPDESDRKRAAYLKALAADNCRSGGVWWAGDAANFSIGQGDVLVTPLQLARGYAALANGGTVFSPRIGKRIERPDGTVVRTIAPPVVGKIDVSRRTLRFIRDALAGVPREGTAAGAFAGFPLKRFPVAGKTGTAEAYGRQDTSWFASFAPAKDPKYVVVVVVSQGGTGGTTAAPAAREIWEGIDALTHHKKHPKKHKKGGGR